MNTINNDYIQVAYMINHIEDNYELFSKEWEIAHAISYAWNTGRISRGFEMIISGGHNQIREFIKQVAIFWDGEESTHGAMKIINMLTA